LLVVRRWQDGFGPAAFAPGPLGVWLSSLTVVVGGQTMGVGAAVDLWVSVDSGVGEAAYMVQ
jgi:hypothetical protein